MSEVPLYGPLAKGCAIEGVCEDPVLDGPASGKRAQRASAYM